MAKHTIIAGGPLQVLGHEGTVESGTVLATIETDCDLAGLLNLLQFGSAIVAADESEDESAEAKADPKPPRRRPAARTQAPAGATSPGTKAAARRRR